VLATSEERRVILLPGTTQLLQLEDWHHPNVVEEEERPSGSESFQQVAKVLASEDTAHYRPFLSPKYALAKLA
jgi:hypothetical protein